MQEQEALAFIGGQRWTFAKTMPQHPHEYVVRGKGNDPAQFDDMVRFIRRHGVARGWGRKTYLQWYAPDGHHYWTMGWPIGGEHGRDKTIIINRAASDADTTYDAKPNERWSSPDGKMPVLS